MKMGKSKKQVDFIYRRDPDRPFSITSIFDQLAVYVEQMETEPGVILFPPHEYYFLRYICKTSNPPLDPETIFGIDIGITYKKQSVSFIGI